MVSRTLWTRGTPPLFPIVLLSSFAGCAEAARENAVVIDGPVPEYSAPVLDGDTVTLASLRGDAVLLNVWATWCAPCRDEMPELQALHERYQDRGLRVIGVSVDDAGSVRAVREFVNEMGITFAILHDAQDLVSRRFRLHGVPETFLIDRSGTLRYRWTGRFEPFEPDALARIEAALEP